MLLSLSGLSRLGTRALRTAGGDDATAAVRCRCRAVLCIVHLCARWADTLCDLAQAHGSAPSLHVGAADCKCVDLWPNMRAERDLPPCGRARVVALGRRERRRRRRRRHGRMPLAAGRRQRLCIGCAAARRPAHTHARCVARPWRGRPRRVRRARALGPARPAAQRRGRRQRRGRAGAGCEAWRRGGRSRGRGGRAARRASAAALGAARERHAVHAAAAEPAHGAGVRGGARVRVGAGPAAAEPARWPHACA